MTNTSSECPKRQSSFLGGQSPKFQVFSWIKIFDKIKLLVLHFSDSLVVTPGVGQYLTPLGLSRISLNPQATLLWLRSIWFSIHISCFEMGARFPVFVFIFSEFVFFSSFLSVATLKQLSFGSAGDTVLILGDFFNPASPENVSRLSPPPPKIAWPAPAPP